MKALLFANTDWYLFNFRLALAKALRAQGHEVILLSPPGEYGTLLEREGFRWIGFPLSRGVNPLSELVTLWRLVALYRAERPDLVHHFTIKCVLYGGIAARIARARAIVSAVTGLGHLFVTSSWRNRLIRPLVSLAYRFVFTRSEIVFQNPDDLGDFLRLGLVDETRTHLVRGSGVDTEYFRPAVDGQRRSGPARVLMVGRLLREKGVREFVKAAEIVHRKHPDVRFLLAGTPDYGNPSSIQPDVISKWRGKGDVEFLGHRSDIRDITLGADLAVLPSYREGMPKSLAEAAACGLAIVASDVPGCREIVLHGVNGLLVPPRDSQRLAEAIVELLGDQERREAMGKRSRALACEIFSQERVLQETMEVYAQALRME